MNKDHRIYARLLSQLIVCASILLLSSRRLIGETWSEVTEASYDGNAAPPHFLRMKYKNHIPAIPIAWLMSFPNSGTSYTSAIVRATTGQRTASNYRQESAIVDEVLPNGPFYSYCPECDENQRGYLLTKTHCGGTCLLFMHMIPICARSRLCNLYPTLCMFLALEYYSYQDIAINVHQRITMRLQKPFLNGALMEILALMILIVKI